MSINFRIFFCALSICCCLLCLALCRQLRASNLGCFTDGTDGLRDIKGLKFIGMERVGSASVSQISDANSQDWGTVMSEQMTHELCASICALGGFQFMALQASSWCYCGNSYGSQGTSPDSECMLNCVGNSSQNCGGNYRNRVFQLSYPGVGPLTAPSCQSPLQFVKGNRTFVQINHSAGPAFGTVAALNLLECVTRCTAGCQAVIFNQQQRLCHLLEYAVVPAALSSASSGDFFVRG